MTDAPKLAGVVGWPISHSLSPAIHGFWATRAGVNGLYVPVAAAPRYDDFAAIVEALRDFGFQGVNVTIPHKEHALRYADQASKEAQDAGAANMLTFHDDHVEADNSDIIGFENALRSSLGGAPTPKRALVLGAGGAARGVILALKRVGVETIAIANRTREKAQAFATPFGVDVVDWALRDDACADADILVNTTSLGMTGQPALELSLDALPPDAIVADIVYAPLETDLLKAAKDRGCKTADGLAMLMHQAVPGFRAWFGAEASVDAALRTALVRELERRRAS